MTTGTVDARVAEIQRAVEARNGVLKGADWWFTCPFSQNHTNGDRNPSARWNPVKRTFFCDPCGEGGGWTALAKLILDEPLSAPASPPKPGTDQRPHSVTTYDYTRADRTLAFQVIRMSDKSFRQRRPDPDKPGDWIWSLSGVERVPYRLPELVTAPSSAIVFIPEGEKDVDNLIALGGVATTNPGGAGKWRAEYASALTGRPVVVLADQDDPGRRHARQVAASVSRVAASVKVIEMFPGLEDSTKADVSDWIATGQTLDDLYELADRTPPWTPRGVVSGFGGVVSEGFGDIDVQRNLRVGPEGFGGFGALDALPGFPTHVFPAPIQTYIDHSARTIGIAADFIGVPLLAYIAGVIGHSYFLHIKDGWDLFLSFWTCVIAETGTGKKV